MEFQDADALLNPARCRSRWGSSGSTRGCCTWLRAPTCATARGGCSNGGSDSRRTTSNTHGGIPATTSRRSGGRRALTPISDRPQEVEERIGRDEVLRLWIAFHDPTETFSADGYQTAVEGGDISTAVCARIGIGDEPPRDEHGRPHWSGWPGRSSVSRRASRRPRSASSCPRGRPLRDDQIERHVGGSSSSLSTS